MSKANQIIQLLKGVNTQSIWGYAIRTVVKSKQSTAVMDLVIELRSQARDNPKLMREIVGQEAYTAIMSI